MIKKLRIKLIAVSMLAMFIVLGTIVIAANIFNYRKIITDSDSILTILMDNDGKFPESMKKHPKPEDFQDDFKRPDHFSPETPFESRFFSVTLDKNGTALDAESLQVAATNQDGAKAMAQDVYSRGSSTGFYDTYRFLKGDTQDGYRIIFLDCRRSLDNFRHFLLTSTLISLIGLGAVFVLVLIFSRRIVKPVSESYEKQKEFITNAGHEIKTPLSIINADAEVIAMENGESEWTEDIKNQTMRLSELTNDLIFLAKMEESVKKSDIIDFPLSELVNEASNPFFAPAKTGRKSFSTDISPGLSMKGDEKSIFKLVTLLLDNALKYSPEDGFIHLALSKQKNRIILNVTNTTDYTPEQKTLDHFFDRFYRADKSHNSAKGGYGIGLSIAKAIVEQHKGKIRAIAKDANCIVVEVSFPVL